MCPDIESAFKTLSRLDAYGKPITVAKTYFTVTRVQQNYLDQLTVTLGGVDSFDLNLN